MRLRFQFVNKQACSTYMPACLLLFLLTFFLHSCAVVRNGSMPELRFKRIIPDVKVGLGPELIIDICNTKDVKPK